MNIGVRVCVLEKFGDGWWKVLVENQENDHQLPQIIGLYPSNYLQEDTEVNGSNAKNVRKHFFSHGIFSY